MANKANEILSANEGMVWLNDTLLGNVASVEAKATADFDEVELVGDSRTYQRYKGFKGEGTLKLKKVNSMAIKMFAEGIKTGIFPDCKIITKNATLNGKGVERIALLDVTVSELQLVNMEAKALVEEELPFTFTNFDILETI